MSIRVYDPEGELVYDGPTPLPPGVATVSLEELAAGRLFRFELDDEGLPWLENLEAT